MKAGDLNAIDKTLELRPLNAGNYDEYYVMTKAGRGDDQTSKLIRRFQNLDENRDLKILFSGFKGSGKSTELARLKKELETDFLINVFSVIDELDPTNVTIAEILISVMTNLFAFADEYKEIKLSKKLVKNIEGWLDTVVTEKVRYNYINGEIETKADIGTGFLKIFNVGLKLKSDFKSGARFKTIVRGEERKHLPELILNCNLLLGEIKQQLGKINKKNIIFIIDDLEKVDLEVAENIFYNNAKQMTSLVGCFIYTFPISLVYNQKYNIIRSEFHDTVPLPMIMVHDKEGKDFKNGIDSIAGIVYRRVEEHLISKTLLSQFIRMSGGVLRDLFRMLHLAAYNALEDGREAISKKDFSVSFSVLKTDYYNTISYNEKTDMSAEDYYKILADCYNDPNKRPLDVKGSMDLKHNLCILGFNGDGWFDVHPVVKEILLEKKDDPGEEEAWQLTRKKR
ncbi:MAG: hypothetical protein GY754_11035 [bacterium]|nr:hypothetical protein [bacterium]